MVERRIRLGRRTARISFDGRSFVLPADDPYDLEMVREHSRYLARRYQRAVVETDGRRVVILGDAVDAADEALRALA